MTLGLFVAHSNSDPFGMGAPVVDAEFGNQPTVVGEERRITDSHPSHIDIIMRIDAMQERIDIASEDTEKFRHGIKQDLSTLKARVDATVTMVQSATNSVRLIETATLANTAQTTKIIELVHTLVMRSK